ncbi:hypothetical protein [Antribacter gilvus]|uniref:hypothetical protein n=1 Tax=Antribacter gilvus TaxID=2304675 RepID=UPI000F7B02D7|nr:hypothetical protein [Antribacter gilvus]
MTLLTSERRRLGAAWRTLVRVFLTIARKPAVERVSADRPLPRLTVSTAPTLPGWVFRPLLGVAAAALIAGAAARTEPLTVGLVSSVGTILVAVLVVRPGPTVVGVLLVGSGLLLAGSDLAPFDPWVLLLAPLGYVVARLAWFADRVPLTARVERAALVQGWRRDATILAGTTLLGALALVATGISAGVGVLLGGLSLVVLVWLVALATSGPARDDGED